MTRILIVDDVALVREPIAAALAARGFETLCAANGEECLAAVSAQPPDLILLDLAMPRCNGIAVLKALQMHARHAAIPVVLLTEVTDKTMILEAARLGVRDCVLKSHFSLTELIDRIHRRLGTSPSTDSATPPTADGSSDAQGASPEQYE
jgi:CheY-like chemotaxis protein